MEVLTSGDKTATIGVSIRQKIDALPMSSHLWWLVGEEWWSPDAVADNQSDSIHRMSVVLVPTIYITLL